uniref:Uncharacterized protein n=1 Tax=Arundo donax TaxID=35708 RepID=A0A0A9DFW8_ARUDO
MDIIHWVTRWTESSILPVVASHLHTSLGVRPGDHYKAFTKRPPTYRHPLRYHC